MKTFTLTEQHITLLRAMYVDWNDCESGAPAVDPKCPYGNSNVVRDVIELIDPDNVDAFDGEDESDAALNAVNDAMRLHHETDTALQIVLFTGQFVPGTYVQCDEYDSRKWRLA
jgi:hypothetical protein